jgi:hypothetical protein
MAKSRVVSNAKEFARAIDKVGQEYGRQVMTAMSYTIDEGRELAAQEIIPSNIPGRVVRWYGGRARAMGLKEDERGRRRMVDAYKIQKAVPGKVTERTGLLGKTLRTKGSWNITTSRARFTAPHWGINIRPQAEGKTISFVANIRLHESGPVSDMRGRLLQEERKGRKYLEPGLRKGFDHRIAPELIQRVLERRFTA